MANILAIRFAALGDVAITIPSAVSFAKQYPNDNLYILSNKNFVSLFENLAPNIHFIGADLKGEHKGIKGLYKLSQQLKTYNIYAIADLHNVIRSWIVCFFLGFWFKNIARRKKDKKDRLKLLRKTNKDMAELKSYHQRFADVFAAIGYTFKFNFTKINTITPLQKPNDEKWIGIAPFAAFEQKIYPLDKTEKIIEYFSNNNIKVFLFGGGKKETLVFDNWVNKFDNVISAAGKYNLKQELGLMSQMNLMLTMDSGNMHLAALVGTNVFSIWGASHPAVGFRPYNCNADNFIQAELACRPCSEWGAKPCYRGDFACMNNIEPQYIINKLNAYLN